MATEDSKQYIQFGADFADIIRTTLGPRGMNKMIISNKGTIMTNDGATIINSMDGENPIIQIFKDLARSQEEAIGDGTSSSCLLAGQLLSNALTLINKGIHPTTIITGYNFARQKAMSYLSKLPEKVNVGNIIETSFGSKLPKDIVEHLNNILQNVKDYENLRTYKVDNSDPFKTEVFKGHVFNGFTLNDRMSNQVKGNIAVIDFPINVRVDNFSVTNADELEKIERYDSLKIRKIIDKLSELDVKCLFYTDTSPEFETYLTSKNITGIVVYEREQIDRICKATKSISISAVDQIDDEHIGKGEMTYKRGDHKTKGTVYLKGDLETLVIHGSTTQVLDEMERSIHDVVSLLKHDLGSVVGAGSVELRTANDLINFAKQVGGKEQLAIEKFAESLEAIPMILAENCGLDAIDVVTKLKTLHNEGHIDFGVDQVLGVSNAREREVFEPVLVKLHAINTATNVATQILKLDKILQGKEVKE